MKKLDVKRNYVIRINRVKFVTDEGTGEDHVASMILSQKFDLTTITFRVRSKQQAVSEIFSYLKSVSGFEVDDLDYDITVS